MVISQLSNMRLPRRAKALLAMTAYVGVIAEVGPKQSLGNLAVFNNRDCPVFDTNMRKVLFK